MILNRISNYFSKLAPNKLPKRLQKNLSLSILTGFLIGTSYIPFPPWAIFFCFVPLWLAWLDAESYREVFLTGWISQFVLMLIGFNWVAYTVHSFGHLPYWAAIITLFLFCSFASLNIPIAGVIWFRFFRKASRASQVIGFVTLTSITERLYPMIFDWHLGYTWLWIGWPAYQLADIFGFFGLSTLTITANGLVLWSQLAYAQKRPYLKPIAIGFSIFVFMNIWGYFRVHALPEPDRQAEVMIVQANIGDLEKEYVEHGDFAKQSIIDKYFKLTSEALRDRKTTPTFAIWPETAFPDAIVDAKMAFGFPAQLREFLKNHHLALITGAYGVAEKKISNLLFSLSEDGTWASAPYPKTHLLAFGEYIPGSIWFPQIKEWIPEVSDFGRGQGPQILNLKNMRLGAQICYEGLFDSFSRGLANKNAQMIVNVTNDSWFGTHEEPFQHLYMTLARAVETRRPLIRSTNTGISTVILANGEILTTSPTRSEWTHTYEIPYLENPTQPPFLTWGFYLFPVILGLTLAGALFWRKWHWRQAS
jgi:apolipoprotein N-acyltransferase